MRKFMVMLMVVAAIAVMTAGQAIAWHDGYAEVTITGGVVTDNTLSSAATIPRGVDYFTIYVPTITSATVSVKVSPDGGTTYDDLFCLNNGTNSVLWSSAAGTGGMYLSPPPDCRISFFNRLKVYTGAAQAADRTFKVYFKKDATKNSNN